MIQMALQFDFEKEKHKLTSVNMTVCISIIIYRIILNHCLLRRLLNALSPSFNFRYK